MLLVNANVFTGVFTKHKWFSDFHMEKCLSFLFPHFSLSFRILKHSVLSFYFRKQIQMGIFSMFYVSEALALFFYLL